MEGILQFDDVLHHTSASYCLFLSLAGRVRVSLASAQAQENYAFESEPDY